MLVVEYRRNAALCVIGAAFGQGEFGEYADSVAVRELQCQAQACATAASDENVVIRAGLLSQRFNLIRIERLKVKKIISCFRRTVIFFVLAELMRFNSVHHIIK